jgi:predicted RNase H-like nuclease (RuvC/YqgF family)
MKKIKSQKNIILFTFIALIIISTIVSIIFLFPKDKVNADDTVDMKYFNETISKLETEISNIKSQNNELSVKLDEKEKIISELLTKSDECSKNITTISNKVNSNTTSLTKLNKWYDLNKQIYKPISFKTDNGSGIYYNEYYIKSALNNFFTNN